MDYSLTYDPDLDFDAVYTQATIRAIAEWVRPADRVLELGCATGLMTAELVARGASVVAVDRSELYLERLAERELPGVTPVHADLLEAWPEGSGFDHVLATSLLHELPDPSAFLGEARERLAPAGLLHVSVPNPRSLHRLVALEMGWLESLDELSERLRTYSILRMLGPEQLDAIAASNGLRVVHREGVMLKPLPNAQMAELPAEVLEGFVRVARHVPDLCAMNLFVLRRA